MALNTQGTKFEISDDGTTFESLGCVSGWDWQKPERSTIDTTCTTSTEKEFKFGLPDNGTLTCDYFYGPQDNGQGIIEDAYESEESYHFQVTYGDEAAAGGTGTVKAFEGFVTAYGETGQVDDVIYGSVTIKLTGAVTVTPPTGP